MVKQMRVLKGKYLRIKVISLLLGGLLVLWLWGSGLNLLRVLAAEGTVYFGSEAYTWNTGDVSPLGVYFDGSIAVESYSICLEYDSNMLSYLDGADRVEGNLLWIEGGGGENSYKRMLHFEPLEEGDTVVRMVSAEGIGMVTSEDGTVVEEEFEVGALVQAPIAVQKKVSSNLRSLKIEAADGMEEFSPEIVEYHLKVAYGVERLALEYETEDEAVRVSVSDTALAVGSNVVTLTVQGVRTEPVVYTLYVEREEKGTEEVVGNGAAGTAGTGNGETGGGRTEAGDGETSADAETGKMGVEAGKNGMEGEKDESDGQSEEVGAGEKASLEGDREQGDENSDIGKKIGGLEPSLFIALVLVGSVSIFYIAFQFKGRKKKRPVVRKRKREDEAFRLINLEQTVIDVRHVSMNFRLAQEETSSLKEYMIRTLKGQNHYRMLPALKDITFEVNQGEVLGIVGTNGSGKSTLLKIIAGALLPSQGEVIVDKSKVQMLTLGTGFDMELTAKENVYLNGAIIGYSKEYIDEKYEDIVAFAELEGFMEERMKNFSSGMVSRLGFAIATMRDSPDILILDEVLSVGDMFFRKKSEKRIREMIHSGATVLIVSHSADVIRKNCDRAVWIEKGVLRMVGKPEVVCGAYEKMEKQVKVCG